MGGTWLQVQDASKAFLSHISSRTKAVTEEATRCSCSCVIEQCVRGDKIAEDTLEWLAV